MATFRINVTLCAFEARDDFKHLPGYVVEAEDILAALEKVYVAHQNGLGPCRSSELKVRSLSVGDVVHADGQFAYVVTAAGFAPLTRAQLVDWLALDKRDRAFGAFDLIGLAA